jgi:hypothetical protein
VFDDAVHMGPQSGLLDDFAARTARQREAQQVIRVANHAPAPDSVCTERQFVKTETEREAEAYI